MMARQQAALASESSANMVPRAGTFMSIDPFSVPASTFQDRAPQVFSGPNGLPFKLPSTAPVQKSGSSVLNGALPQPSLVQRGAQREVPVLNHTPAHPARSNAAKVAPQPSPVQRVDGRIPNLNGASQPAPSDVVKVTPQPSPVPRKSPATPVQQTTVANGLNTANGTTSGKAAADGAPNPPDNNSPSKFKNAVPKPFDWLTGNYDLSKRKWWYVLDRKSFEIQRLFCVSFLVLHWRLGWDGWRYLRLYFREAFMNSLTFLTHLGGVLLTATGRTWDLALSAFVILIPHGMNVDFFIF
jgi:hypothetical protein